MSMYVSSLRIHTNEAPLHSKPCIVSTEKCGNGLKVQREYKEQGRPSNQKNRDIPPPQLLTDFFLIR
jgi:hypothetical protein